MRLQRTHMVLAAGILLAGCGGLKLQQVLRPGESDWPMFGRTETRANVAPMTITPPLSEVWKYDVTGGIGAGSPVVVDSVLLVGNLRGELHAVNTFTGRRLGWVGLGDAIEGSPVLDGGDAIVAISNSRESLLSLELATGRIVWTKEYGDIASSPLLLQKRIYVGNLAGKFFCISREDGNMEWTFSLPENTKRKGIRSSPAASANTVLFGADDGTVYALDATTGERRWTYEAGAPVVATPVIADSAVFVGTLDGSFHAVDLESGLSRWVVQTGTAIYAGAAVSGHVVLIGSTGGNLFALDTRSGKQLWKTNLGSVINAGAVVSGSTAFVGTLNKFLFAVAIGDGSIVWKYEMQGRIKTPVVVARDRLFVATDDRTITAFQGGGL